MYLFYYYLAYNDSRCNKKNKCLIIILKTSKWSNNAQRIIKHKFILSYLPNMVFVTVVFSVVRLSFICYIISYVIPFLHRTALSL